MSSRSCRLLENAESQLNQWEKFITRNITEFGEHQKKNTIILQHFDKRLEEDKDTKLGEVMKKIPITSIASLTTDHIEIVRDILAADEAHTQIMHNQLERLKYHLNNLTRISQLKLKKQAKRRAQKKSPLQQS